MLFIYVILLTHHNRGGGMAIEVKLSHQYSIAFCCHVTDGNRGAVWQMVSDMEEQMKQSLEFNSSRWKKIVSIDICWHRNGDQTIDVSIARWRVVCLYSGDSNMKDKLCSIHSCHTKKWRVSWLAHLHESADYIQEAVWRAEYLLQCVGNDGGNIGTSQNSCQVVLTNAHTRRTPYASLSRL